MADVDDSDKLYGYLAEFQTADALLAAARRLHDAGYRRLDAFSPFPLEGLSEAVGAEDSAIPYWMLGGGLFGALGGYAIQYFSAVIDYPILSGGKPFNSWPAFIPVTFELAVLFAALTGFIALVLTNGLPRLHHPLFEVPRFNLATRDRFFLVIRVNDPLFDRQRTRRQLDECRPAGVFEVPA
jgi:hypothetical protein